MDNRSRFWWLLSWALLLGGCNVNISRDFCEEAAGSDLGPAFFLRQGLPAGASPLDAGYNCVESGHKGPKSDRIYTNLDNPRIWTQILLSGNVPTVEGSFAQELLSNTHGWRCAYCDLPTVMSLGDGPPTSTNVSGQNGSVVDTLWPWTSDPGHWGAGDPRSVTLVTNGLRVGYTKLEFQQNLSPPTGATQEAGFPADISLDPNVLLVPIQVFVLYSDQHPVDQYLASVRLPFQLALWDRVPGVLDHNHLTDGNGVNIASIAHFDNWVKGGEGQPGSATENGFFLPDDVWDACNIQFRLVSYTEKKTEDANVFPNDPNQLDIRAPLTQNFSVVSTDPNFLPNVPTMIFTVLCTPNGLAEQGSVTMPAGISLPDQRAVGCVSVSQSGVRPAVPTHELGHVILQTPNHVTEPSCLGLNSNLMCPVPSGARVTSGQCSAARSNIQSFRWSDFFPKDQ